ncbi:hypothetical protein LVJ94_49755 [Pendulispora rubella]|uniref:Uncharacterized protein n=1 Tax=Pendulispora rubella TaxID=2741070 RepID=A0ABZ2L2J6_9BACT
MNSIRLASVVGAFAFGLVGYASEALAESPVGSVDPSSIYQPSPNSRPLAVQPPVGVTGVVGSPARVAPAQTAKVAPKVATATTTSATFYNPSPNERTVILTAPAMPAPAHIETVQPAMALNYTASTAYQPSPNYIKPVQSATQTAQQRTAALRVSASEGLPGVSPNLR